MWVRSLVDSDEWCGDKARHLGQLLAAGLPVPPGFVIDVRAFAGIVGALDLGDPEAVGHVLGAAAARLESAELPAALVEAVAAAMAALGAAALAVRSSSPVEDTQTGAAPGLFASLVDVPARDVWTAIRAVWTSALTPIAASYTKARAASPIAVVVQRFVPGERVTIYTRPPGAPQADELWIQRGDGLAKQPHAAVAAGEVGALALAAERAIGARAGADVELVVGDDATVWIVQARPIVQRVAPARVGPPPMMLAALVADGRVWRLDVTHNPEPLSVAQAGLVERVEQAAIAPWSMRVCGGYLYTTAAPERAAPAITIRDAAELAARAAAIDARIASALGGDEEALPLEDALARYLAFYRIWACELAPLIAAARVHLGPAHLPGARPSAVEATLIDAARDLITIDVARARLGPLAPAWDVAVPTFAEHPDAIADAVARMRLALGVIDDAVRADPERTDPSVALARAGADLAEREDFHFAHAQWRVRRAILARAATLGWPADDVCWLSLDDVIAGTLALETVRRRAAAARAAADRASQWAMPIVVGAEVPAEIPDRGHALRGVGHGGTVSGRVRRLDGRTLSRINRGDVVVVRAVTPALAVVVAGCAALVSETGGLLDHGAAMARELGIPCVVGCRDVWSRLVEGQVVTVSGDAGVVMVEARGADAT